MSASFLLAQPSRGPLPKHVAVIMDGNGRWAQARGKPRVSGHERGAERVKTIVKAAGALGIEVLTLYAFSADNWKRPAAEIEAIMALFRKYLQDQTRTRNESKIHLNIIGYRGRLAPDLVSLIASAEAATFAPQNPLLRIAFDYSAKAAILRAARGAKAPENTRDFERNLARAMNQNRAAPPVDLMIRTGGERRLSDFLLWESAYAELDFLNKAWPDFEEADLQQALDRFRTRQRRFGAVPGH